MTLSRNWFGAAVVVALIATTVAIDAGPRRHRHRPTGDRDGVTEGDRDGERRHHHHRRHRAHPCTVLEFDADGDGALSDEERAAAVAARRAELLAEFDADEDGELSDEERAAARAAKMAEREARIAARIAEFDADGDGELNDEERAAAHAARIAEYDTDGDGELSDEERAAAAAARCAGSDADNEEEEGEAMVLELALSLQFLRGDSNFDGAVNIADAIDLLGFLFLGSETPLCLDSADANDDGSINISDPSATLATLFSGAGPLPPPTGTPGIDPTDDALSCGGASGF